jgi:NAD(P)-dependent dehydrogenase (short-subunit alcohol dehydrogenase family)
MGFPEQQQKVPGIQAKMNPVPDCGEDSYRGSGRLTGKAAVITGADSGIGRAVAIAYAREGADVLISYLDEDEDAKEVAELVTQAGRKAVLMPGDLSDAAHCRAVIDRAVREFGKIDVLVSNAAFQMTHETLEEISDEEFDHTVKLNINAYFYLVKAALGVPRSTPTCPPRRWRPTRRPKPPSPTSPPASPSCWASAESGSTALPPGPSGPR